MGLSSGSIMRIFVMVGLMNERRCKCHNQTHLSVGDGNMMSGLIDLCKGKCLTVMEHGDIWGNSTKGALQYKEKLGHKRKQSMQS